MLECMITFDKWNLVKWFSISGDYVSKIVVPEGIERFDCVNCALREVVLPDSLKEFFVPENKLVSIELPCGIESVNVSDNLLRRITFRGDSNMIAKNLRNFEADNNRLVELDFPVYNKLGYISIDNNPLLKTERISKDIRDFLEKQKQLEEEPEYEFRYNDLPPISEGFIIRGRIKKSGRRFSAESI